MADAVDLGNVAVTVGQQAKFVLTFANTPPSAVWLKSDGGSVAIPALEDGTPLTWPDEVTLTSGTGTYFILGVSPGVIEYSLSTDNDPDTAAFANGSITVTESTAGGQPSDSETVIQVLAIAEPILITIISQPDPVTGSN